MHEIYELKDMLMQELEEYGRKGELKDVGSLEIVDKLAHAIKNLCKIIESSEDEEYSMEGSYARGGQGGNTSGARGRSGGGQGGGGSYRSSYARNRRRDSMGRYSREGERRRYSREGGYSREGDEMEEMVESIRGMMQELPQEVQRDAQKFVQALEQVM
ncbi:MAG: hypothetical protein J6P40_04400 [Oscillospiraceae bacterium]|nr:hypothetical protein [Oscillospiraceae bacterium]